MIPITDFIIMMLFVLRIASMFLNEFGVNNIFERIRNRFGIQYVRNGKAWVKINHKEDEVLANPTGWFAFFNGILDCIFCITPWIGFLIVPVYFISPAVAIFISLPFSLSMMAIITKKYFQI